MCGIVAIANYKPDQWVNEKMLADMCQIIRHRGPDDQGLLIDKNIGLGMRRLSIIDLSTGHQPMSNEDESIWIVYNGECYNFLEWREYLKQKGHQFKTNSDTETIIHLYEEFGYDCLKKINGMFSFCLWDKNRQELFIARDRLGVKPLYYTRTSARLILSSEIKAILLDPQVSREVDLESFSNYLTFRFAPHPKTMFKGIFKLPAGHFMIYKDENIKIHQYWEVEFKEPMKQKKPQQYIDEFLALLKDAVRLRLISDVPLGAFLSGGLDSTTIVALMSQLISQPVKTFSIGFGDCVGDRTYWDERDFSALAAKFYQTDHHELPVKADMISLLPKLVWHLDEPIADPGALPTMIVSELARQYVTVSLSGMGADETIGGYKKYTANTIVNYYRLLPKGLLEGCISKLPLKPLLRYRINKSLAFFQLQDEIDRCVTLLGSINNESKNRLISESVRASLPGFRSQEVYKHLLENKTIASALNRLLYLEMKTYLSDQLLPITDKTSMAHSLEVRTPFLDYRLVEFEAGVPPQLKVRGLTTKYLLKKAVVDLVPKEIIWRKKQGFSVPIDQWFKKELKNYLPNLIKDKGFKKACLFNTDYIAWLIHEHGRSGYFSFELWAIIVFDLWYKAYIERIEDLEGYIQRLCQAQK